MHNLVWSFVRSAHTVRIRDITVNILAFQCYIFAPCMHCKMHQNVLFILVWRNQKLPVNAVSDPIVIESVYCGIGYQVFAMLQGTHSSPALTHIASARLPGLTLGLQEQVWINPHYHIAHRHVWAEAPEDQQFTQPHPLTWPCMHWGESYPSAWSRDCPVSSGKALPASYPSFSVLIALSQSPSTTHSSMLPVSRISQKLLVCCKELFFFSCGPSQLNACSNAKSCSELQPGRKRPYYSKN